MSKKRCTDIKTNQRVMLPSPLSAQEEAEIAVQTRRTLQIAREYIEEKCNKEGEQTQVGISQEVLNGINKLRKRYKEGELVVRTTDKSKRICICSYDSYVRQGQVHVGADREIGDEEVRIIQKKVNTTARSLMKLFRIGEGL